MIFYYVYNLIKLYNFERRTIVNSMHTLLLDNMLLKKYMYNILHLYSSIIFNKIPCNISNQSTQKSFFHNKERNISKGNHYDGQTDGLEYLNCIDGLN